MKKKNIQACFKKYIVKRPKGMCQILFSLTVLDDLCDEIEKEVFNERVLDILEVISELSKEARKEKNQDEFNGYNHSYAIVKLLLKNDQIINPSHQVGCEVRE